MKTKSLTSLTFFCLVGLVAIAPESFSQTAAPSEKRARPARKVAVYDASVPKATLTAVRYGNTPHFPALQSSPRLRPAGRSGPTAVSGASR